MRWLLAAFLIFLSTLAAVAQEEDKDRLTRFLEDTLSGAGRQVTVEGFRGALSSRATMDRLAISDDQGVWLELTDAVLDWNRAAILAGRIEINELSAGVIRLPRLPASEAAPASPEATPFALPDLPVSVNIEKIEAGRVELGAPVAGVALTASLEGNMRLNDGEGEANLDITRLDGPRGEFDIAARYSNGSGVLSVDVTIAEEKGGIVATQLGLPGAPALDLTAKGEGPIDDFTADVALKSDGEDRLTGQVATVAGGEGEARVIRVDLTGDLAPLFIPQYRDFFGPEVGLKSRVSLFPDGRVEMDELSATAAALNLNGTFAIGADGLPERFRLDAVLRDPSGAPVLLPIAGTETRVQMALLNASFDAASGRRWTLQGDLNGLLRDGLTLETARLTGGGEIVAGATPRVTARLDAEADGIALDDPALQQALGESAQFGADIQWQSGAPVLFDNLALTAEGLSLTGSGVLDSSGDEPVIDGGLMAKIADTGRLSLLAGQDLGGAIDAQVDGQAMPLSGGFDLDLTVTATDLSAGMDGIDNLLRGQSTIQLSAVRDTSGLTIRQADISANGASLTANGTLKSLEETQVFDGLASLSFQDLSRLSELVGRDLAGDVNADLNGTARFDASRFDAELAVIGQGLAVGIDGVDDILSEASTLDISALRDDEGIRIRRAELTGKGAKATITGLYTPYADSPGFDGIIEAQLDDLGVLSGLAGRDLGGSLDARLNGFALLNGQQFDLDLLANGQNLRTGLADADRLLTGPSRVVLSAARDGETITLKQAQLTATGANLDASGTVIPTGENAGFDGSIKARLDDLGALSELAKRDLGGSLNASLTGQARFDGSAFDLSVTGEGQDIRTGMPDVDGLLRGASRLNLSALREDETITIRQATLTATGASLDAAGTVVPTGPEAGFNGAANARLDDLGALSTLAGRDLGGSLNAAVNGQVLFDASRFDVTLSGEGRNIRVGIPDVDALFTGTSTLDLSAKREDGTITLRQGNLTATGLTASGNGELRDTDGTLTFDARLADLGRFVPDLAGPATVRGRAVKTASGLTVSLDGEAPRAIRLNADVSLPDGGAPSARFDASIGSLAWIAPELAGPASIRGTARQNGDQWVIDTNASGAGGVTANVAGSVVADASRANIDATGTLPLGLINARLSPNSIQGLARFDLALNGPLALSSVSGTITTADTRLAIPSLRNALTGITATVNLSGGNATFETRGTLETGGGVGVQGRVRLEAPMVTEAVVSLNDLRITDPQLYETRANGQLRLSGTAPSSLALTGQLDLGQTELRVPNTGIGSFGEIPDITHINETAAQRRTRSYAGLLDVTGAGNGGGGGGTAIALDVQINALNQIFVRGRGLDAELGGSLRVTGTTADVIPQGRFDLIRGRLDVLGKRLTLEEGSARLQGDLVPMLRLVAKTTAEDTTVFVTIEGPADSPEIKFTSDPSLPEDEVLARLLFGKDISSISALQAVQLASAVATLAGKGGVGIIEKLRQNTGFDDLDVTSDGNGGATVRAGKYISENAYTNVEIDSSGQTSINLNLDLTPSTTVRGRVGSDGSTGIGLFFERDY
ncbi:translocation/assembly module TamB domain-containing protein [Tropicibacter sp. S64]|uniref:translocation/assembly module TamB domain-containing protein n=1 Tax=Tropicibacter sp. S64 TaxID=3415122 RepID=UPI003C7C108E